MTNIAPITPEAEAVALDAQTMHAQALAFRVLDKLTADEAGHSLRMLKDRAKAIDETRKAMTRPLDETKRVIMDFFRPAEAALAAAEQHLKREVLGWQSREEEAARQRAEAERKAAEEAARAAREAEEQAVALAAEGGSIEAITAALDHAEQQQSRAAVASVSSLIAGEQRSRAVGVTTRAKWIARVTDLGELVKAAATRPDLLAYLLPNEPALRALAALTKGPSAVPGVEFVEERIAAIR